LPTRAWVRAFFDGIFRGNWADLKRPAGEAGKSQPQLTVHVFANMWPQVGCCLLNPSSADANDSGGLDITDPIFILGFLFLGSAPPPPPLERCRPDPAPDDLDCNAFTACGG
jgi:hypothetical protein